MKLTIQGELTDLNSYINAERRNLHIAAKIKRDETARVSSECMASGIFNKRLKVPVFLKITWYCKNKRKDRDNICFAKKFICDGLVLARVIPNDGWNDIVGFSDTFEIEKKHPRVEVDIIQA